MASPVIARMSLSGNAASELQQQIAQLKDEEDFEGWSNWRRQIHYTLDVPSHSKLAMIISAFGFILIILSAIFFTVETLPQFHSTDPTFWETSEAIVVIIFSIDYVLRVATAHNPLGYAKQAFNIIDLLAILPWYIELGLQNSDGIGGLAVIRVVRLTRVFRIFKLSRHSTGIKVFSITLKNSRDALGLLFFLLVICMVVFSSALYFVELMESRWIEEEKAWYRLDETTPSPFQSIPHTFWWCIVTMTTVGYGDAVPKTNGGKFVGILCMISGILVIAFPISVIGATFTETWNTYRAQEQQQKKLKDTAAHWKNFKKVSPDNREGSPENGDAGMPALKAASQEKATTNKPGGYLSVDTSDPSEKKKGVSPRTVEVQRPSAEIVPPTPTDNNGSSGGGGGAALTLGVLNQNAVDSGDEAPARTEGLKLSPQAMQSLETQSKELSNVINSVREVLQKSMAQRDQINTLLKRAKMTQLNEERDKDYEGMERKLSGSTRSVSFAESEDGDAPKPKENGH
eukprot:GFYU01008685.1.p1 GENE.GFYU01008685.1~~GFYU01008685.1.p1  ORF type:complete len:515 (-),score=103.85 GFYU01008685.1:769-2313(-)